MPELQPRRYEKNCVLTREGLIEIAKIFTDHYTKISIDPYMKSNSKKYIRRKKKITNHTTNQTTAPGKDYIHPQIIKKLPPQTLKYLLDLYNMIWEEAIVPEGWKSATITPLLKERKDPKDVRSYSAKHLKGEGEGEKIDDRHLALEI